MIAGKRKRAYTRFCVWLVLAVCATMAMGQAQAGPVQGTGVDFQIKADFDPYALGGKPSPFLKGVAEALEKVTLQGHGVLQGDQADIQGTLDLNGLPALDYRLTGWGERLRLSGSFLGKEPVIITPPNYMPFLLKFYYYFDVPVQYFGLLTDLYSYNYGVIPVANKWKELTGGTESRALSPEECILRAQEMSQFIKENQAFEFWRTALLQHVGMDEVVDEFFYMLPEWTAGLVKGGGLDIQVSEQGELWTLGGETVYALTRAEDASTWQLTLPEWEGLTLVGQGGMAHGENGLQVSMDWKLMAGEMVQAYFSVEGKDLPEEGQAQGEGTITVAYGGEMLGEEESIRLGLAWNQRREGKKTVLDGSISWLNNTTGQKIVSLSGQISFFETEESFEPETMESLQGIDFFCMNDTTIKEFYANAKWSLVRTAIPFLIELPAGFLNGIADWAGENGMMITAVDGLF